jgi:hypothetical protein
VAGSVVLTILRRTFNGAGRAVSGRRAEGVVTSLPRPCCREDLAELALRIETEV